jgi:uncharacterized protein YjbI with pentapeptide repeats
MASEEHLAIFKQGAKVWNKWRRPSLGSLLAGDGILIFPDLSGVDLEDHYDGFDLSSYDFTEANLSGTYLYQADLTEAQLWGANLSRANLGGANLSKANLIGAKLSKAILNEANLTEADLIEAALSEAELVRTQALGTNCERAIFTGACIEDWNINSATNLKGVICDYIYLKAGQGVLPQENPLERRPSSGNFAPGAFTKLFQKARETVDLIFRNGVDWQAVLISLQQLRVENDSEELSIQAIENKNDGAFVIRVNVPPNADKAKIEQFFKQRYTKALKSLDEKYKYQLQAKDEQIATHRQNNANIMELAKLMAARPIENTAIAMSESTDQSRNINISGGTVNTTGAGAMSLGDISGTIANTINQLPASSESDKPGIKELLQQLQKAIEAEPSLSEEDKAEALEQVKALAEAGKAPQEGAMQKIAKRSTTMLKGIVASLPEAAKLAVEYAKLLPMITSLFGLG